MCPLSNLKHANKYNHEKRIQYGHEIDVSSIGHGQFPLAGKQELLVFNSH
ncbi:hypothetical protein SLEP1_g56106 [Rubroshorea leprosula]|uniref:Uncharacterized protein n=1 Tax=Rubroshorea leprosula TaxID=152421 RepID=A0AAV5MIL8_9ROSI|nr:hypothetical protein SLEP1_g56106 [Rubroshorea leprosula]